MRLSSVGICLGVVIVGLFAACKKDKTPVYQGKWKDVSTKLSNYTNYVTFDEKGIYTAETYHQLSSGFETALVRRGSYVHSSDTILIIINSEYERLGEEGEWTGVSTIKTPLLLKITIYQASDDKLGLNWYYDGYPPNGREYVRVSY